MEKANYFLPLPYLFLHQSPDVDMLEARSVGDQRRSGGLTRSWRIFLFEKS